MLSSSQGGHQTPLPRTLAHALRLPGGGTRAVWRRGGLLLGVALAAVAGLRWAGDGTARTPGTAAAAVRLGADSSGRVAQWLLALPQHHQALFLPTQADLIAKADPAIRFHVLYADEVARDHLLRLLAARGVDGTQRVAWHRNPEPVSAWARDVLLTGADAGGAPLALLHHPRHYASAGPAGLPVDPLAYVNAMHRVRAVATGLRAEGGKVVADEEHAFVSHSALDAAVRHHDVPTEAAALAGFEATWGLPVTPLATADLGTSDHCDLYLMPVGRRRVVVGSPRLAAQLLQGAAAGEREAFVAALRALARRAESPVPDVLGPNRDVVAELIGDSTAPEKLRAFQRLRRDLDAAGYACEEVPFLALRPQPGSPRLVLTYANVVQDERQGASVVYLPRYGLASLDRHAAATWKRLGCDVVTVDSLGPALHGGAIRCLSQVVKEPAAKPPSAAQTSNGSSGSRRVTR